MRITIIGNCASGKSTLAKRISEKFNIPHLHLDRLWFQAGGHLINKEVAAEKERARSYIRTEVKQFICKDSWVSDGWYSQVQPLILERADQLVFLDIPLWRRLMNHLFRTFFDRRHPELSVWQDLRFTSRIITRTFSHGKQMKEYIKYHPEKLVHLRTHKEVDKYFENLVR